ncbi:MAG TPA: type II toxin-antitoxin system Phd/YefM family antitoxin [Kofleriaceae bacterium]
MVSFNIYEAKTQLSKLLRRVRAGQEIIISDAGTPIAKLVPVEQPKAERVLGEDRGKIWVAPDAFDPLSAEDLAMWSGPLFPEPQKRPQRAPARRRRRRAGRGARS